MYAMVLLDIEKQNCSEPRHLKVLSKIVVWVHIYCQGAVQWVKDKVLVIQFKKAADVYALKRTKQEYPWIYNSISITTLVNCSLVRYASLLSCELYIVSCCMLASYFSSVDKYGHVYFYSSCNNSPAVYQLAFPHLFLVVTFVITHKYCLPPVVCPSSVFGPYVDSIWD